MTNCKQEISHHECESQELFCRFLLDKQVHQIQIVHSCQCAHLALGFKPCCTVHQFTASCVWAECLHILGLYPTCHIHIHIHIQLYFVRVASMPVCFSKKSMKICEIIISFSE